MGSGDYNKGFYGIVSSLAKSNELPSKPYLEPTTRILRVATWSLSMGP